MSKETQRTEANPIFFIVFFCTMFLGNLITILMHTFQVFTLWGYLLVPIAISVILYFQLVRGVKIFKRLDYSKESDFYETSSEDWNDSIHNPLSTTNMSNTGMFGTPANSIQDTIDASHRTY